METDFNVNTWTEKEIVDCIYKILSFSLLFKVYIYVYILSSVIYAADSLNQIFKCVYLMRKQFTLFKYVFYPFHEIQLVKLFLNFNK